MELGLQSWSKIIWHPIFAPVLPRKIFNQAFFPLTFYLVVLRTIVPYVYPLFQRGSVFFPEDGGKKWLRNIGTAVSNYKLRGGGSNVHNHSHETYALCYSWIWKDFLDPHPYIDVTTHSRWGLRKPEAAISYVSDVFMRILMDCIFNVWWGPRPLYARLFSVMK